MQRNKVVLVDQHDNPLGEMDKLEAHQKGILHRAFSIFLFNTDGEMLIHQRAANKYHGGGLWTNACCSHPQWNEDIVDSASERLQFEMGMYGNFKKAFSFIYHSPVENGLIEHEFDHILIGHSNVQPNPHPDEVQDYKWMNQFELQKSIQQQPEDYTFWFKEAIKEVWQSY